MRHIVVRRVLAFLLPACMAFVALHAQEPAAPPTTAAQPAPKDLRPLLTARASEMRLVTARYALDRTTLNGNYLGGGRGGAVRGGQNAPPPEPLSPGRLARLKRFDLDWQAALSAIDPADLSPAARSDLDAIKQAVQSNLAQLEADAATMARVAPLVPFAPAIVRLVESRIRLEDIDPEKAAGTITEVAKQVAGVKAKLEAGLAPNGGPDALRVPKDVAQRGPATVETLRSALNEWFTFYNGYDPLFTWWNGLAFKKADAELRAYAAFLKEKVAPAEGGSSNPALAAASIAPAPAPTFPSVPDLKELLALPQDELTDIVQRFRGPAAPGGGRGDSPAPTASGAPAAGARGATSAAAPVSAARPASSRGAAAAPAPVVRNRAFFEAWLKALKTLDFDKLSRNAQVDYLYIRKMADLQIARDGQVLPENPPRKTDASGIPGNARGRQGLINDLQDELIPYSPDELIAIAEKEFAWCEVEMKQASRQVGFGDDWKQALETMKEIHPPPGGQVAVIRDLMFEAVGYLRAKELLTVPAVAAESLHMIMMTPERQLVNPFFTGGTEISVSYPTDTMEYDARLQSMRGNNTPFSHATAFHEMIPGHNLVFYTTARYRGYRPSLGGDSPVYSEGWPLYWELTMYEKGFHDTPEKKIGALFWRMHRCARIIFSLKFHMGEWSPQECVDFLVDRVGFERENAIGEVRRSFQGGYGPLYQAAYLLGGIQLRGLRKEVVDAGLMTEKAFHDEILRQGAMPITLLRLVLGGQKLTRDMNVDWRFYGPPPDRPQGATPSMLLPIARIAATSSPGSTPGTW
jgi:hypothetical protein